MVPNRKDFMIVNLLKKDLRKERLFVVFQPIIAAKTRTMVGMETLVRWKSSGDSVISPLSFIPAAERMGYMPVLGRWIIDKALSHFRSTCYAHHLFVTINVSLTQLKDVEFVDYLVRTCVRYDVPPSQVVLELTESVAVAHPSTLLTVLVMLRKRGFRLAMDDFGSGYSSLGRLSWMPLDVVKLDRSFLEDWETNPKTDVVLTGVLAIMDRLGVEVVVEGVETALQANRLSALNPALLLQGYWFSKPVLPSVLAGTYSFPS